MCRRYRRGQADAFERQSVAQTLLSVLDRQECLSHTPLRMRRISLAILFVTVFIDLIGFGMVIPFLSFYAREYGASGVAVGAVVGIYSIMQFFFAPVWGRWSDY